MKRNEFSSEKLSSFVEYFDNKDKVDRTNPKYAVAMKFEKMMEVFKSELIEIRKVKKMSEIFPKAAEFAKQYAFLEKLTGNEDYECFAQMAEAISEYYQTREENGIKDRAKELMELEENHYFDDYRYAYDFVMEYICYDESPYLHDFLEKTGLRKSMFERFVDIIKVLNPSLYEDYLDKAAMNKNLRCLATFQKVANIRDGVTKGMTTDGRTFDEIEFFKNLPFFDKESSDEVLEDFKIPKTAMMDRRLKTLFQRLEPHTFDDIMKYIYENGLRFGESGYSITEKEIRSTKYFVAGREITDSDKDCMITYMKENKIPFLAKAFALVKDRYLNEGLELKEKENLGKIKKEA